MRRTRRRWRRSPTARPRRRAAQIGLVAANQVIRARSVDGLMMPIGITSSFPTLKPGPGVWRLRRRSHRRRRRGSASVRPFILQSAAQFLPPRRRRSRAPTGSRRSTRSRRTAARTAACVPLEQTNIAQFWTANVVRQYNGVAREIADARQLDLLQTARLAAMVNVVGADAGIAVMNAKYHYLFWRPVSAIDPTAVSPDGFGPVPGYDDGNPATVEQTGLAAAPRDAEPSRIPGGARRR